MMRPVLLLAAALSLPAAAAAQTAGTAYASAFDLMFKVDLAQHTAQQIGATGTYAGQPIAIEGMSFAPDGTLYATSDNLKALFRIDPSNGEATRIGDLGLAGQGQGSFDNLDLSLAATCDGNLWLSSTVTEQLWRLNRSSGAATLVGSLGARISGLAARGNTLYGAGARGDENLYQIDTDDGSATMVGGYGPDLPFVNPIAISFAPSGTLFATLNYYDPPDTPPAEFNDLGRVDPDSGHISILGPITGPSSLQGIPMRGLAIAPPQCRGSVPPPGVGSPVPALGDLARLLLMLATLLAGTFALRLGQSR